MIWSALAADDFLPDDADRVILAWLTVLPVTTPPPEAAARLLRRYVPRIRRFDPGTERLLELLVLISRYGRKRRPENGDHHEAEE